MAQGKEVAIKTINTSLKRSAALLPALGLNDDVFKRLMLNCFAKNPKLAECNEASLVFAVDQALQWGVIPDGYHAAIVPYKGKATLIVMVGGYLQKVRKALPGISIQAHTVYNEDEFEDVRGSKPDLVHRPDPDADRAPANIKAVYAIAFHPGNPMPEYEVLYRNEIDRFKALSPAGNNPKGPWATHYGEMGEVRALKRLCKRLPIGPEFSDMFDDTEALSEEPEPVEAAKDITPVEEAPEPAEKPKQTRTRKKAAPKQEPEPAPEPEPEPVQEAEAPASDEDEFEEYVPEGDDGAQPDLEDLY